MVIRLITHIKCGKTHLGIIRTETKTDYRVLADRVNIGTIEYKGNWKTEKVIRGGGIKLKCLSCETIIETGKELDGCSDFVIDKNKGVVFVSDALDRFTE